MRTPRQVKAITSQLEVLEELRMQLESIQAHITEVMKKGTSWIEEVDNKSYAEINQLLSNETVESLRRCSRIADGDEEVFTFPPTKKEDHINTERQPYAVPSMNLKEHNSLMQRLCSVEKSIISLQESGKYMKETYSKMSQYYEKNNSMANKSETVDILSQKFDDQEKQNKTIWKRIAKMNAKSELKLEELAVQSQASGDFMTDMKKEIEAFTKKTNSNMQQKYVEFEDKFRTVLARQISAEDKFCLKIDEINSEISGINDSLNKIKSQQESLCDKNNESQKRLNELCAFVDIVKTKHQSVIDQEGNDGRCHESLKEIEESNRKEFELIQNGYQTTNESLQILQTEIKDRSLQCELFREYASLNISTIKKDVTDTSTILSTLKATTNSFVSSQTQKTKNVEKKITAISSKVDKLSQDFSKFYYSIRIYIVALCGAASFKLKI